MNGYQHPYARSPYGGMLSATQGFLNAYLQHQKIRQEQRRWEINNQFRQSLETERGLDIEYKQHRLAFAKKFPQQVFGDKPTQIFTQGRIAQTLGELESGGAASIFGYVIPFGDKEDMINHALRKLGPNWEQLVPRAREIINRKWPSEEAPQVPQKRTRMPQAGQTFPVVPKSPSVSRLPGMPPQPPQKPTPKELLSQTESWLEKPMAEEPSAAELDEWAGDWLETPAAEPKPKGLFERAADWIKSKTSYQGPAGLFPSEEKATEPKGTSVSTVPSVTLEDRKKRTARKGRIRSWVVPFNLKYGKRLQPSVLDEMDDEYIDWLSSLSIEEREAELQKISEGAEPKRPLFEKPPQDPLGIR